ncbi:hypothetical protein [Halomarina rubra]|uniref:DUF6199 domain-containing protein n=1 Tax=Halomarina rubra TaxID=2071873 RepID=A0ABD6ASX4_9EURY|nr:hypothetical protein [Halomarina rubra]
MVEPSTVVFGSLAGLAGLALATNAETVARFEERLDAVGSARDGPVAPAEWKVHGHRALGVVLVLVGALFTVAGFLR